MERSVFMGFLLPFLLCAFFLLVCYFLCNFFLALYTFSVIRALWRLPALNHSNTAALLSVYFGAKSLFRGRWFPKRSPNGTVYREIPFILVMGRKIFVLEICPYPGTIANTEEADWHIDPPKDYQRKKEVRVPNPVLLAKEREEMLRDLFGVLKMPFEVTIESMAILTDKRHKLVNSPCEGLYSLPEAVTYLSQFSANTKPMKKKMKKESEVILAILNHFSLSRARAISRNDRMRRKMR